MIRCKVLSKKYKGGGSAPTTIQSVPDWAVPYLQNVGNQAEDLYGQGQLGQVAGVNPILQALYGSSTQAIADKTNQGFDALDAQQGRLAEAATSGGYDTGALKDKAILEAQQRTAGLGKEYGASGTLGSGQQQVKQGVQNAATAAQFADIDAKAAQQTFVNKMTAEGAIGSNVSGQSNLASGAAQALSQIGSSGRTIEQEGLDSGWQALQRYASTIYGNTARQSAVAGAGGK